MAGASDSGEERAGDAVARQRRGRAGDPAPRHRRSRASRCDDGARAGGGKRLAAADYQRAADFVRAGCLLDIYLSESSGYREDDSKEAFHGIKGRGMRG